MSPSLDYRNGVPAGRTRVSIGEIWGRPPAAPSFYNGSPGRELVTCPDCQRFADALFGDHGGECYPGAPRMRAVLCVRRSAGQSRTPGASQLQGSTATVLLRLGARLGRSA